MDNEEPDSLLSWYVIRTLSKQEYRAARNLMTLGVSIITPMIRWYCRNEFSGELKQKVKPLFPRYIFARFRIYDLIHKVRYTRGVHSIVSMGMYPARVDDEIISILQSQMSDDSFVKISDQLKAGDEVIMKDGPLKNFTGIFERGMKDSERVVILLNAVNYQAHFETERDQVRKCN